MDCHELWHSTEQKYMDPEGFGLNLNNLIQNLRNVTWLLQKQKAQLLDFDTWYQEWRDSARDDAVMKWIVAARNRIVKEADLELLSRADIRLSLDWVHEYAATWTMPPRYTTRQILIRLLSDQHVPPIGLLTIERRWVDRKLPDRELLEALRYAYFKTASVIATAHEKSGVAECDLSLRKSCVTPSIPRYPLVCMEQWNENRRLHINLANREEITERAVIIEADPVKAAQVGKVYGDLDVTGCDAIDLVPQIIENYKRMLVVNGTLLASSWLFAGKRVIDLYHPTFFDQASKRLALRKLADRVELLRADSVLFICEAWYAQMEEGEFSNPSAVPAGERPNRMEAIEVDAIARDGRQTCSICTFHHAPDGQIVIGETIHGVEGPANFLEPIRERWRKTISDS